MKSFLLRPRTARILLPLLLILGVIAPSAIASVSINPQPVQGFSNSDVSSSNPIPVIVQFRGPPAADAEVAAKSRGQNWTVAQREQAKSAVAAGQDVVLQRVAGAGIPAQIDQTELFGAAGVRVTKEWRFTYLFNGVRMRVPGNLLPRLAGVTGVAGVFDDRPVTVPLLDGSVPYTQAPSVWNAGPPIGNKGEGQVIAVIDSGIDWNHPMFNAAYPEPAPPPAGPNEGCDDGAPTCIGPKHAKVVYAASINAGPSPFDAVIGHGTHVSSIAAGDSEIGDHPSPSGHLKGTAPAALLMAFKTLSDAGVGLAASSITAMEEASQDTADHPKADVMNLSLGSLDPNNTVDQPNAVAADNASRLGVVMAIAAGNCGAPGNALCPSGREGAATTSAPGTSRLAISVAASADPGPPTASPIVQLPDEDGDPTYPAVIVPATGGENPFEGAEPIQERFVNCGGADSPSDCGGEAEGKIGLIFRGQQQSIDLPPERCEQTGVCSVSPAEGAKDRAQAAGVIAIVFVNNKVAGQTGDEPYDRSLVSSTIPVLGITFNAGEAIKGFGFGTTTPALGAVSTQDLRMTMTATPPPFTPFMADFSSRGPLSDYSVKPDVAAPGINILAAQNVTGEYVNNSGTSMASPHVAGLSALLLAAHPEWGPEEVKAALMNTASIIPLGVPNDTSITKQGAGETRVFTAATTPVLLSPPSFSFGQVATPASSGQVSFQKFRLTDVRPAAATGTMTYGLSVQNHVRLPNALFSVSFRNPADLLGAAITSVVVPDGGSVDFMLRVEVQPGLPESPKDGTPDDDTDDYINFEGYEFYVIADPVAEAPNVHAPVFYRHVNSAPTPPLPLTLADPGDTTNTTGTFQLDWNEIQTASSYVVEESSNCKPIFPVSTAEDSTVPSDDETWASNGLWTVSPAQNHTPDGSKSLFAGQGPAWNSTLTSESFEGATTFSFWEFRDTEPEFDFTRVRATFDAGAPQVLREVSGSSGGWAQVTVHDLPSGTTGLQLNYTTDEVNDAPFFQGWYVDDAVIHSGGPWTQIAQTTDTNFTVTDRPDGEYCYRVGAIQQVGDSFQNIGYSNLGDIAVNIPFDCGLLPTSGWFPYDPGFNGGVHVATGDIDGDGCDEVITGAGPGGGPHVRVFTGQGIPLSDFFAYDVGFSGGVRVAAADVDGDNKDEIITGAGPGGGPHVRVYEADGTLINGFFPYDTGFSGGVFVGAGDVSGDSAPEIITGAGAGGGPHVRVLDTAGNTLASFFPYDVGFTGGVHVAAGDVRNGTKAEVITGPGAGTTPRVQILDGAGSSLDNFLAYDSGFRGGVRVASADADEGGKFEVITGAGPGGGPHVRLFNGSGSLISGFFPYDVGFSGGVFVAGGNPSLANEDREIVTGAGAGGGPHVRIFE